MGIFSKGFAFLLKDFACWTSTHGIPHIGGSNNIWLRLFWVVVVIGCVIGFLVQLQTLITRYLRFEVNTETTLSFEQRPFPVVTICHLNPWKVAPAEVSSAYMADLISAYSAQTASSDFGFSSKRNGARQQRAMRLTTLASERLFAVAGANNSTNGTTTNTDDDPGYNLSDLVIACTYDAATCNYTEMFSSYKDPTYGRCVQFNFDMTQTSSRAGPLYGLRLTLRTDQAQYLPWTESAGVVVAVHDKLELPYPDVFGYYAPIGTAAALGVKYVKTTRKPKPYGDCSTNTEADFPNFKGNYQVEACLRSCTQGEVIKQCGCYYPGLPYAEGDKYPSCYVDAINSTAYGSTSNNLNCIDGVLSGFDILKQCTCPQPCQVNTYATTVSTAKWPSAGYTPNECTEKDQTLMPWMDNQAGRRNKSLCLAWYKKNTLLIEVYYERMNYQILTESAAYTFVACLSEIAGQVGLFLGMSIISVFEFFTLVLLIIYYVSSHRSRRLELEQIEEYVQKAEKDRAEKDRKQTEKEANRRAEKLRKEADLYDDTHHDSVVPPKVTDADL